MLKKLNIFLEKHKLITEKQYGFRAKRSTALALIELIEKITFATEKKQHTVGVFIDLSKAFDTINHSLLLSKSYNYGIRGPAHQWLKSYLNNRQQFVQINGQRSDLKDIICGVPQGSVLGPLLFLLFINDLCEVSKVLHFLMFADDTNFFYSGNNLSEITENINSEMGKVKKWFDKNKLCLNWEKTKYMIFGNCKKNENVRIAIEGNEIERVNEIKFLGVILNDKLNWKDHIVYIKSKVCKSIGVLYQVKDVLDCFSLHMLYNSLILPYFGYCTEVWGNTYSSNTRSLFLLQKKALRIINKTGYREHTNSLFVNSGLLKFKDLVDLKILIFMWKAKQRVLPMFLQNLFTLVSEEDGHRRQYYFKTLFARTVLHKNRCVCQFTELNYGTPWTMN